MIGKTISHYKILEKLGEGGMGEVYLAEDTKLDRKVALKFLPKEYTRDNEAKERFKREAKAAAALNHPNIVTIHEINEFEDQIYIAMEYVDGQTLKESLTPNPLPLNQVIDISTQICEGLQKAHDAGIVHRDIKPQNIIINKDGTVKILDFGLAKLKGVSQLTKQSSTLGTVHYMSPEQTMGKKVDHRSDIWSLGVVLYEMLTGQLPFKGDYEQAVIYSILNEQPEPIQKNAPELPSEFIYLFNRVLEKDPKNRYQSVNEALIDLRRIKRDSLNKSQKTFSEIPEINSTNKSSGYKIALWLVFGVIGIAVVFLISFYFMEKGRKKPAFKQMQITRLTSHGKAKDAAISPEGRYIVHVMKDGGKESLWLRQVAANSNVQILPPEEVSFRELIFSSDGNYIYYTSSEFGKAIPVLYRMPVLGGSSTKILESVSGSLSFSPDNKYFAFIRNNLSMGRTMLLITAVDGVNERILAERIFPEGMFLPGLAWSPDGSSIICSEFRKDSKSCSLVRVNIETGKESIIGSQKWGFINDITWSAGTHNIIINGSFQRFGGQIWSVIYPDGELHRITNDLNTYRGLSLTEDGSSLITVKSETQSSIWFLPEGKSEGAKQITTGKYDGSAGLESTTDGKIVYGSQDMKLWLINSDGSHLKCLSSEEDLDFLPSVSRDGSKIIFTSISVSILELWKMNIDGSNRSKLADYAGDPKISPDGNWVIYTSAHKGHFTLMKLSINGGEPLPVIDQPAFGGVISPNGNRIACFLGDDKEMDKLKIAVFPFEGGEPEQVFDLPKGLDINSRLNWTPDGHNLAYIITQEDISNVWIQPLRGGSSKQITNFKENLIFNFDWLQDGAIVCSRGQIDNDVILIRDIK